MFATLAEEILESLPVTAEMRRREAPLPADRDLRRRLLTVRTFDDLLDALRVLEFVISARNTLHLAEYSWTAPLEKQDDRSAAVRAEALVLHRTYRTVAAKAARVMVAGLPPGADQGAVGAAKADFRALLPRITVDTGDSYAGTGEFLRTIREVLLLSLAVGTRGPAGQCLLGRLAGDERVRIVIDLRYKAGPGRLRAYPPSGGTEHRAGPGAPALGPVNPVDKGAGSHSHLGAAVWLTADQDARGLAPTLFTEHLPAALALERLLSGSISFGRGEYAFYSPPRVDLMHELLHVAHNADGVNRAGVKLPRGITAQLWTDTEEYTTIAAGDLTENDFGAEIGLPARHGHGTLAIEELRGASAAAADSLATHSRLR